MLVADNVPVAEPWVQYGSFGLIAFGVIVILPGGMYYLRILISEMLDKHAAVVAANNEANLKVVNSLTNTFATESRECREERVASATADRVSRHELANAITCLSGQVELLMDRQGRATK